MKERLEFFELEQVYDLLANAIDEVGRVTRRCSSVNSALPWRT